MQACKAALASGYRHIDTAIVYRNETEVGEAVRQSGVDRKDLFISRSHIIDLLSDPGLIVKYSIETHQPLPRLQHHFEGRGRLFVASGPW